MGLTRGRRRRAAARKTRGIRARTPRTLIAITVRRARAAPSRGPWAQLLLVPTALRGAFMRMLRGEGSKIHIIYYNLQVLELELKKVELGEDYKQKISEVSENDEKMQEEDEFGKKNGKNFDIQKKSPKKSRKFTYTIEKTRFSRLENFKKPEATSPILKSILTKHLITQKTTFEVFGLTKIKPKKPKNPTILESR